MFKMESIYTAKTWRNRLSYRKNSQMPLKQIAWLFSKFHRVDSALAGSRNLLSEKQWSVELVDLHQALFRSNIFEYMFFRAYR